MEINTTFSLIIDKLNKKITELNIILSKDANDIEAQNALDILLADRDMFFKGNSEELETLITKYGDLINE